MLHDEQQKLFDDLVDGDRYAQTEGFAEKGLLYGLQLALSVLHDEPRARPYALHYIYRFGNWQDFQLSARDRILLERWNEEGEDREE